MTITGAPGGTAASTTAGTTLAAFAGTGAPWAAGDLVVVIVGCDNSGPSGASPIVGVSDTRGHVYTQHHNFKKSNSTSPNGAEALGIYTTKVGNTGLASGDTITVTFNPSTASRTMVIWQFRSTLGDWAFDPPDKTDEGYGTAISWSGFQVAAGHCVIGCGAAEYGAAAPGGDTDTQYGTWSTKHYARANTGSAGTSITTTSQWKVPSTTGTQQFTATVGSSSTDWISVGFVFREVQSVAIQAAMAASFGALAGWMIPQIIVGVTGATMAAAFGDLTAIIVGDVSADLTLGCPLTPAHGAGGEWAPGWRIVVEAFYDPSAGERNYGALRYGDRFYGGAQVEGAGWIDITQPAFHIEIGDGMAGGEPRVTVSEVVVEFLDPHGVWFDINVRAFYPQPGALLRVYLIDPGAVIHPLISAEIERIEDVHDGAHPRTVSVRGFGRVMDLVIDVPAVNLPTQLASERFRTLTALAEWQQPSPLTFPAGDAPLLALFAPAIVLRDEMDRTCQSVGWFMDSDRAGYLRVREWPHLPEGPPVVITDCAGTDALVSHSIAFANDESHLLNYVVTSNSAISNVVVEEPPSITRFGRRGRSFGFPLANLAWSDPATAQQWARRAVERYAYITRQVESFEADTIVDARWLDTLADLDTGRSVYVLRTGPKPAAFEGVITGWRYTLDPGRWVATLYVSTITKS